jgi:hypothetical protein
MAKARDILGSGALGIGPALLAKNPSMLKGFGLLGNLAYDKFGRKKEDGAPMDPAEAAAMPAMKKGGKVKAKSSTKYTRGDGVCKKGHTKGRMV